jgi:hypothetical protein
VGQRAEGERSDARDAMRPLPCAYASFDWNALISDGGGACVQDLVTGQGIDYDESMHAMQLLVQAKVDAQRAEGARAQAERAEVRRAPAGDDERLSFPRGCTCGTYRETTEWKGVAV